MRSKPVYSEGLIHVMERMCSTCIFRPGNKMFLDEGRVEQMVAEATAAESCIPCHTTIHDQAKQQAVCRGFYERHATLPIRLAQAMGLIREVPKHDPS